MQEDPTFRVHTDKDTGQTIISGMGELHLEIIIDRLVREFNVGANVGKPQVAYKETITQEASGEGRYIRQTGGRGQYGHAKIQHAADDRGAISSSTTRSSAASIPKEFIKPIEQGIKEALETGPLAGYPVHRGRGRPLRGQLPRRRLLGDRVQDRRLDGLPGRLQAGAAGASWSR